MNISNSDYINVFQWVGLISIFLALVSFIGLWYFSNKEEIEKDKEINSLKESTTILEYSEVAQLDWHGGKYSFNSMVKENTDLTRMMEGTYTINGDRFQFMKGDATIEKLKKVIEKYPKFPFAYYGVAYCMQQKNDNEWIEYAKKTMSILEITTQIEGHNTTHDKVLNELKVKLKE